MANRLTYFQVPAHDPHRAARFYAAVLGWQTDTRADGVVGFSDDEARVIGRWVTDRVAGDSGLLPYFTVAGVRESVALAPAYGGSVVAAPYVEGDILVARLRDSEGNTIGIWQFSEPVNL